MDRSNSVEVVVQYKDGADINSMVIDGMIALMNSFNQQVIDTIEGINPSKEPSRLQWLKERLYKIAGDNKVGGTNCIKTVQRNYLRLKALSERLNITQLSIFGNLILEGVHQKGGIRIGTICIRTSKNPLGGNEGLSMDSTEKIISETKVYLENTSYK